MSILEPKNELRLFLILILFYQKLTLFFRNIIALYCLTTQNLETHSRTHLWHVLDKDRISGDCSVSRLWPKSPAPPGPLTDPPPGGNAAHRQLDVSVLSAHTHHPLPPLSQVTLQDTHITSRHQSHVIQKILFTSTSAENARFLFLWIIGMRLLSTQNPKQMK